MLVFSNCKINIGLRITGKRPDGYHNIESVFYPVPWYDAVEIIESTTLSLTMSGLEIQGDPSQNLCLKAWNLLKKDNNDLPPVETHLHKTIPVGAGLGGGSANGAYMLKSLNQKFSLGLSAEQIFSYALQLGSDCPFFILNTPAVARKRGEELKQVNLDLQGLTLVIVNPRIHVQTGWAFKQLNPPLPNKPIEDTIQLPVEKWATAGISNDFETPVFYHYPEIAAVKARLLKEGAVYAAMSGTGSTCYGFFRHKPSIPPETFPPHYFVKQFLV